MGTELMFIGPTYRDVNFFRQTNSPVYLYSFDYLAPGAMPTLNPGLRDSAVMHGWDMQYIYGNPGGRGAEGGWHVTSDDMETKKFCVNSWTNFIKHGYNFSCHAVCRYIFVGGYSMINQWCTRVRFNSALPTYSPARR